MLHLPSVVLDQSSKRWFPIITNSQRAAVLESLGLFQGLTWWSCWKVGKTHFLDQTWVQKPQNCPNSISHKPLVIESWLTPQNDGKTWITTSVLKYLYPSDYFLLIGIQSMQGWTATTRHGVTRKRNTKRLQHTRNQFRKNLQFKDVC